MALTEEFINRNVFIDLERDTVCGLEQMYVDYPRRFATVEFPLVDTEALAKIADRIRMEAGYPPMYPVGGYTDETCDNDGWYEFSISISGCREGQTDNCIQFTVMNSDYEDNEAAYTIGLTEEEQRFLYSRLDAQCREYLEKSCREILLEAEKKMTEQEWELPVIGSYCLCNTAAVCVHVLEDDRVLASINCTDPQWCKIEERDGGPGFMLGPIYVPFDEVMRI